MAKEKGYVYYEADCSMGFTNPFLDIHAKNVFQAQMASAPLKVFHSLEGIFDIIVYNIKVN